MKTISPEQFKAKYGDQAYQSFGSTVTKPGLLQSITDPLKKSFNQVSDISKSTDNPLSQMVQSTGAVGMGVAQSAGQVPVLKQIGEVGNYVGDKVNQASEYIGSKLGSSLANSTNTLAPKVQPTIQKKVTSTEQAVADWATAHPEASRNLKAIPGIVLGGLTVAGALEGGESIVKGAGDLARKAQSVGELAQKGYEAVPGKGKISEAISNTQDYIARSSAPEHMGNSIDRLNESSTRRNLKMEEKPDFMRNKDGKMKFSSKKTNLRADDALGTYDKFYNQEQKFKGDIKQDSALSMVGERTGVAYDKVIQMRRAAGKAQAAELEKIGQIKTDIREPRSKLIQELNDNGLSVNGQGESSTTKTSKVTAQDSNLVADYVRQIRKLGPNPTAAELDAFISRYTGEVDVYKNQNNITKVTNGERIVKANLSELRKSLTPESNPAFEGYSKAKSDYAALSDFLEEGSGFLGKKTLSGDYAKDASLSKSAVQSILNNGKKDFLLKLEDLTGYPAIDEAMLAIKAMQDAGNFRGNSLLELLSPKSGGPDIPTSAKGVVGKILEKGYEYGKEKLAGTPNEQTRRFIMERMRRGKTAIPSQLGD